MTQSKNTSRKVFSKLLPGFYLQAKNHQVMNFMKILMNFANILSVIILFLLLRKKFPKKSKKKY